MLSLLSRLKNKAAFNRKTSFLSDVLLFDWMAIPVTRFFALFRWLTPNMVSVMSGVAGAVAAICYFQQKFLLGGAIMYLSLMLDCVDGNLARKTGRTSPFGAQLDQSMDSIKKVLALGALTSVSHWNHWLVVALIVAHYASFRLLRVNYAEPLKTRLFSGRGLEPPFEPYDLLVILLFVGPLTSFELSLVAVLLIRVMAWFYARRVMAFDAAARESLLSEAKDTVAPNAENDKR